MRRKVVLIRSLPLDLDSRSSKMVADYRQRGFSVSRLFWSRGAAIADQAGTTVFRRAGHYGAGFGNLFNHLAWLAFIARKLVALRNDVEVVHCIDLDSALVAVPVARLLRKKVVFETFDQFAVKFPSRNPFRWFFAAIERRLLAAADLALFPDPIRLVQYGVQSDDHIRFIGNIPEDDDAEARLPRDDDDGRLSLVYVGTLEADRRGLEYIPKLCAEHRSRIEFSVAGIGALSAYFAEQAQALPNLRYLGSQSYDAALSLMRDSDCLYGPYLLTAEAHRFASPNKMYEHLMVGRPLLTNSGTPPGEFVRSHGTGFIFDGSYDDLNRVVAGLTRPECERVGSVARDLWDSSFKLLRRRQVEEYFSRLELLLSSSGRIQAA